MEVVATVSSTFLSGLRPAGRGRYRNSAFGQRSAKRLNVDHAAQRVLGVQELHRKISETGALWHYLGSYFK